MRAAFGALTRALVAAGPSGLWDLGNKATGSAPISADDGELVGRVALVAVGQSASARRATASMGYLVTLPMMATPTPRVG